MKKQNILFATLPEEGHFSPLTSLAIYLTRQGHDVRWYVGGAFGKKVAKLGLYHYPFVKAKTMGQENSRTASAFQVPGGHPDQVSAVASGFVEDLKDIFDGWSFDLIVHDMTFLSTIRIQDLLPVKSVAVGVMPQPDATAPLAGLGSHPVQHLADRWEQHQLPALVQDALLSLTPAQQVRQALYHPGPKNTGFHTTRPVADLHLHIGVPGLEYSHRRHSSHVRYVGAMLPYNRGRKYPFQHAALALKARRVVLVTQGTAERDVEKIIVPTLEAYKNDPSTLVVATTGGSQTGELRRRYPQEHFIIEDFIDFQAVMPYASVYVTNGGYGGVMLALQHNLPIVVAGVHESNKEVAARIAYCRAGLDLKTGAPSPSRIRRAVDQVLTDTTFWTNARRLGREFASYQAHELAARYIAELTEQDLHPSENPLFQTA